jgi:hypothetical protein
VILSGIFIEVRIVALTSPIVYVAFKVSSLPPGCQVTSVAMSFTGAKSVIQSGATAE